ncbi:hypothetical protein A2480_02930 [Candidatus Uhrbacteria bacterium RIFOXYC2_FULL_47_19]|uniref:DUF218 domain-containing protein n=1 Tax=Candidatus Uhrbacteria bacterium RIFOXYC2_FULL_47_19 TaxID=1802424 RepID=A0A1F7WFZ5_9BACT|nr:MAG: hypothetical protein A2480_02930 [Candidatus Uhrbacteria bacterium RIFOXYC2_FULL_47_19]
MIYYVNGYGVPGDIFSDENYQTYLIACLSPMVRSMRGQRRILADAIFGLSGALSSTDRPVVYLAGGATNPCYSDRTEAGEMLRWAEHNGFGDKFDFRLIDQPSDLQGNLRELQRKSGRNAELIIFCEWARQDYMRFLVDRLFVNARVVPIRFDAGMNWLSRPRQLLRLPVKVAGYYSPTIRELIQLPLRRRFMRRQARP